MSIINVGIAGCMGRMGRELIKEIFKDHRLRFVGGFEHPKHENVNKNISELIGVNTDLVVSNNPENIFSNSDVIIDFTTPESTLQNLLMAEKLNTSIVIGTTGLDKTILQAIDTSSKSIAIFQSTNMSIGVNLLMSLVEQGASTLTETEYDIEISETHHKHKIDAPSGTAITLGELAANARNTNLDHVKIYDRTKSSSRRKTGQIGFSVSRGGEIAGEHTVSFIGKNDRIDIAHKAYNRSIFVKGAIEASVFLSKKNTGLYSMSDIINSM